MANRGQKRTEVVDELPADKKACSSLEFQPSSSISSAQTPMNYDHEAQDADMDTSSSNSGSARPEGDGEKESVYGSCDFDNSPREYHSKFKKVLLSSSKEVEESRQLARHESNPDIMLLAIRAITYLCDQSSRFSGFLVRYDAVPALSQINGN